MILLVPTWSYSLSFASPKLSGIQRGYSSTPAQKDLEWPLQRLTLSKHIQKSFKFGRLHPHCADGLSMTQSGYLMTQPAVCISIRTACEDDPCSIQVTKVNEELVATGKYVNLPFVCDFNWIHRLYEEILGWGTCKPTFERNSVVRGHRWIERRSRATSPRHQLPRCTCRKGTPTILVSHSSTPISTNRMCS